MKTVLVVEDTDDLREMFIEMLEGEGYEAIGAINGQDALDRLRSMEHQPCLVLLDMMMPVMDGKAFLAAISETHRLAALPIVVVSAVAREDDVGGHRFVRKPVSQEVLSALVKDYCGTAAP